MTGSLPNPSPHAAINSARSFIDPSLNPLVGARKIMRYLGVKNIITLYKWVEEYGLPAVKRPDGLWMSTCTAIDTWIFMTAELDYKNRAYNRGTGLDPETDLKRTAHLPEAHPRRRRAQNRYDDWVKGGRSPMKSGPKLIQRLEDLPTLHPPAVHSAVYSDKLEETP